MSLQRGGGGVRVGEGVYKLQFTVTNKLSCF